MDSHIAPCSLLELLDNTDSHGSCTLFAFLEDIFTNIELACFKRASRLRPTTSSDLSCVVASCCDMGKSARRLVSGFLRLFSADFQLVVLVHHERIEIYQLVFLLASRDQWLGVFVRDWCYA